MDVVDMVVLEIRIVVVGLVDEVDGMDSRRGIEGLVVCRVGIGGGVRGCLMGLVWDGVEDEEGLIELSGQ